MTQIAAISKRAIVELSPTEQFIRAVERARELRAAALARVDHDFVERVQDAQTRFIDPPAAESPAVESPAPAVNTADVASVAG